MRGATILAIAVAATTLPGAATASDSVTAARPRGTYVVRPDATQLAAPAQQHGGGQHVLFLNRCPGGITIYQGAQDSSITNVSSIVSGSIQLPAYPFGDAAWAELVDGSREMFAPFGITVTDVDPTPAPHDEVVVCGSDVAAGFQPAAGVAPLTCGAIANAVTFVFPETIGDDPRFTIETIAQEAAHAWGLDHEFACEDPMTYLLDCGDKSFQDAELPCGEYEARQCVCGAASQNSFQMITSLFGPGIVDTQAPVGSITSPADGTVFAAGADFDVVVDVGDDTEVQRVVLYVDGEPAAEDGTRPFEGWAVNDGPIGELELYLEIEDAAGNRGVSGVVTVAIGTDASPSAEDDEGDGGESGDAEDDRDDGGTGDDMDADDSGGDAPTSISGGTFPADVARGGGPEGCACQVAPTRTPVFLVLLALPIIARRRRTRAS